MLQSPSTDIGGRIDTHHQATLVMQKVTCFSSGRFLAWSEMYDRNDLK